MSQAIRTLFWLNVFWSVIREIAERKQKKEGKKYAEKDAQMVCIIEKVQSDLDNQYFILHMSTRKTTAESLMIYK